MREITFILDETSTKAKKVLIETNDDNTITIRFENDFTISRACPNDLRDFSKKLNQTIEWLEVWA